MLEKNKQKLERKDRPTWVGYYSRRTPTKVERMRKAEKKHKGRGDDNASSASFFIPM
jgi:hypothetical protein